MNEANTSPAGGAGQPEGQKPSASHWYNPLVALTIHGQENKWWMIYIFLVFNSLLVLGCTTLLSITDYGLLHQLLFTVLCAAGLWVAVVWLFMIPDYVAASNLYSEAAESAECAMPEGLKKPLTERSAQRRLKSALGTIKVAALSLAVLFLIVYLLFLVFTWWSWAHRAA